MSGNRPTQGALTLASERWMICNKNHGRGQIRVTLSPPPECLVVGEHVIPDALDWLMEVQCSRCNQRWLGCQLCNWRCPKKGNIFGRKRGGRKELALSLLYHSNDRTHVANMPQSNQQMPPTASEGDEDDGSWPMDFSTNDDDDLMAAPQELPGQSREAIALSSCDQTEAATQKFLQSFQQRNQHLGTYLLKENGDKMMGARHLVSLACETGKRAGNRITTFSNPAPEFGTQFMLGYTELMQELSVESRRMFVRLVDVAFSTNPSERSGELFGRARVPSTFKEANRVCLKGRNSIANSTPIPGMTLVGVPKEQHVCVDILDAIQYVFTTLPAEIADNMKLVEQSTVAAEPPPSVGSYFQSSDYRDELRKTVELLKHFDLPACFLIMIRWFSDAWDPDATKNNRNGVWSMFLTLMFGPTMEEIVIPVAVGPKSGNHAVAVQQVLDAVKSLGETFIVRDVPRQRNIRIRVATALIQVDRLERSELWGGLHHASNRGRCHGIVAGYDDINHPCYGWCDTCMTSIVSGMLLTADLRPALHVPCEECASYDPTSGLLTGAVPKEIKNASFKLLNDDDGVESGTPTEETLATSENSASNGMDPWLPPVGRPVVASLPDDATSIEGSAPKPFMYGPVQGDQSFLIAAAQFLTYQVWVGSVKTKELAKCWGKVCGLSEGLTLSLFHEAVKHRKAGTLNFDVVFTNDLLPPAWIDESWRQAKFLHAPMHLLFLGILETLMEMIDEWLAFHSLKSSVNQKSSASCDATGKLSLQWLRLLKYGVSTLSRGLWVSEQYCAFAKFMLLPFAGLMFAKAPYNDEVKVVLRAIDSCFVTVSLLMKRSVTSTDILRSTASIKVYLASVDELGRLLYLRNKWKTGCTPSGGTNSTAAGASNASIGGVDDDEMPMLSARVPVPSPSTAGRSGAQKKKKEYKPVSQNNPNHASLPLIVRGMRSHGPPCDQWEGKKGGEASIQEIKPFFQGVCTVDGGNMKAALIRYYRNRTLGEMSRAINEAGGGLFSASDDEVPGRNRYTHVRRYPSVATITEAFGGNNNTLPDSENQQEDVGRMMGGISGQLFESNDNSGSQALCVSVVNRENPSINANLHRVTLTGVKSLYELLCPAVVPGQSSFDRSFAEGFLFVGRPQVDENVFDQTAGGGWSKVTEVAFVPAEEHVWREKKHVVKLQNIVDLKCFFSVVTDDFRRMGRDGRISETTQLTKSLWEDVVDNDGTVQVNWDEVITEKAIDLEKRTNKELSDFLRAHNRPVSGNKAVLIERVLAVYAEQDDSV